MNRARRLSPLLSRARARAPAALAAARGPAGRQLTLAAGYLAAGIAATWPSASYLGRRLPDKGDVSSYVWDLWWTVHQVVHLANPWFTANMAAPAGIALGLDTTMPLAGLAMAPVTLTLGPAASLAVLTALAPGLACYAMYRAARLWLRSPAGAVAAGAFFGLSTMLTFQAWYHLNLCLGALFLPMALEASVRLRRGPRPRRAVILGLVLGASVLINLETAVMAVFLAGLALAPWLIGSLARARRDPAARDPLARDPLARDPLARALQAWRCAGLGALVAGATASPQLLAVAVQLVTDGAAAPDVHGYVAYSAALPGLFAPSPRLGAFGLHWLGSVFQTGSPGEGIPAFGVVLSALALAGLAAAWRRRSAPLLALLWLGGSTAALGLTLHAGRRDYVPLAQTWHGVRVSALMPFTWLVRVPGLSAFREADRLALLGLVAAALLAGCAVDWLGAHARPLLAVAGALGVLEAGWSGSPGVGLMTTAMPALDRPIAADHSGSVVLDVPFGLRGGLGLYGTGIANQALLLAAADGHPRAVAYTSWVPRPTAAAVNAQPFYRGLVAAQRRRPVSSRLLAAARRDVGRVDIGWVLVWPTPGRQVTGAMPGVIRYLTAAGFAFAYRADGISVYRPSDR
jgi:hypothetical protein